jgi:hypothetical protein
MLYDEVYRFFYPDLFDKETSADSERPKPGLESCAIFIKELIKNRAVLYYHELARMGMGHSFRCSSNTFSSDSNGAATVICTLSEIIRWGVAEIAFRRYDVIMS